ncbi:unnamed protein product [Mytilus coruscus]|uniref:Uncharacterized protein n=1 Tax=Mytilus coruscus TaxID=42192 RepID=A0A6J8DU58_MYTCO|nr:unnamed protein product [Mytilus coruscus]
MNVISDLSTSIELTFDVTDQVKTNIDMFRTHLDIQICAITSCGYCPDSLPDEAKTITKCFNRNVRKYKSIIHEIRGDIVATARILENEEVFPQMVNIIYMCGNFLNQHVYPRHEQLKEMKTEADTLFRSRRIEKIHFYKCIIQQIGLLNNVLDEFQQSLKIILQRVICIECNLEDLSE